VQIQSKHRGLTTNMAREYTITDTREITPLYMDIKKAVDAGRAVKVSVRSVATKTNRQLGYYWSVVVPIIQAGMREQGNDLSQVEVNQFLNERFFCHIKTISWVRNGAEFFAQIRKPRSKSGATMDEMSAFIEKCRHFSSEELGKYIPDPAGKGIADNR